MSTSSFYERNITFASNNTVTANSSGVGSDCVVITTSEGSGDLISPETRLLVSKLKAAVFIPAIYVFAGPSNLVNMIIFAKQGLKDRVNLCLFSLALVDFLSVCFIFLLSADKMFIFNTQEIYGPVSSFIISHNLMMLYSTCYGSMVLSVIISLERCFCVLFPLHAKSLLKTKNMAVIILGTIPLVSFLRLVVTAKYTVVCFYDKRKQITFLNLYVTEYQTRNKELLDFLDGIFYGFVITVGCPIIVLISTVITSVKLLQTVRWRKQTSSASTQKEIAVTKMLVLLSIEFLIFALPIAALRIYPLFNPAFSARGRYRELFLVCVNIAEVLTCMGMSFSFVVYFSASSKYREKCKSIFQKICCYGDKANKNLCSTRKQSLSKTTATVHP